jgi:riboflavin biosynthesis pyrimidine reductase
MKIETLFELHEPQNGLLIPELQKLYSGNLSFPEYSDRPYVIGNFVQTVDGIVSYMIPHKSGGNPISGNSEEDHFIMGLLRAVSDAVLIGSGTFRDTTGGERSLLSIYSEAGVLYAKIREKLGKPPTPLRVILTGSGNLNLDDPAFHIEGSKTVIITTNKGVSRLALQSRNKLMNVTVRSIGELNSITPKEVLRILFEEFGVRLLLHEGGPTIFGQWLTAGMIDTLFLTIAPQIIGRSERRPNLAGREVFMPKTAPWMRLIGLKKGVDHLFLRYEMK